MEVFGRMMVCLKEEDVNSVNNGCSLLCFSTMSLRGCFRASAVKVKHCVPCFLLSILHNRSRVCNYTTHTHTHSKK